MAWIVTYDKAENTYVIEDIIVYPQTATTAAVTEWCEITNWFNSWRWNILQNKITRPFPCKHVYLPSSTDITYYNQLLQNLGDMTTIFYDSE